MPNYNGVWSLSTQYQYAADWPSQPFLALVKSGYHNSGTTYRKNVDLINLASAGNATDFGDMETALSYTVGFGSSTRCIFGTGFTGSNSNILEFTTLATTGSFTDFGDAISDYGQTACSSNVRGILAGGYNGGSGRNNISYVTIASAGNTTDFGDLSAVKGYVGSAASPTRGVISGGTTSDTSNALNVIDYITIASAGNASDFGDMSGARFYHAGLSSNTRAVFGGGAGGTVGSANANAINIIEYVTIGSTGNTTDFGDLTVSRGQLAATSGSNGRGVFAGGGTGSASGTDNNTVDFISIATTGNATDFGDLTSAWVNSGATSGSHGGIA